MARVLTLNLRPAEAEVGYSLHVALLDAAGAPQTGRTLDVTRYKRAETPGTAIITNSVGAGNQSVTELGNGIYHIVLERADVDTTGPFSLFIKDNAGPGFEDTIVLLDLWPPQNFEGV